MSKAHPIIAVTGASGSGRSVVRDAVRKVCDRQGLNPAYVDGESFHKYNRAEMKVAQDKAVRAGEPLLTHFGPDANLWEEQKQFFKKYGDSGTGRHRRYLHTQEEADAYGDGTVGPGQFTPCKDIPTNTDFMLYEGLHGAVKTNDVDIESLVDLRIGVVPVVNLEWTQKLLRDVNQRGYSQDEVMNAILGRMGDYVRYVIPQFHHSHINFQKVAVVDTSNPLVARDIPTDSECLFVIRFRDPKDPKVPVDFPYLVDKIPNAKMSRRNTLVIPGGEFGLALELIMPPILNVLLRG
ncbi:phosphoribulokinase [Magnetospira sp. QH-2]|uniref:phosphoribulokinase n=1 Tax=Magnetospira sp. (strain QH-2) TaxID=1288970 RepID=UPI0003E81C20|nr:phosphoribulokinase [Magnetospira sp. QH-2]CCQ73851.1 Phosphoribulokinase, chromosomal [Magnetospira sp. QH-2]